MKGSVFLEENMFPYSVSCTVNWTHTVVENREWLQVHLFILSVLTVKICFDLTWSSPDRFSKAERQQELLHLGLYVVECCTDSSFPYHSHYFFISGFSVSFMLQSRAVKGKWFMNLTFYLFFLTKENLKMWPAFVFSPFYSSQQPFEIKSQILQLFWLRYIDEEYIWTQSIMKTKEPSRKISRKVQKKL